MKSVINIDHVICGACGLKIDRKKENRHCSNCFACTGCEIYYCPGCDKEIIITPVRPMNYSSLTDDAVESDAVS